MKIKVKTIGIIERDLETAKNEIHVLEAKLHNAKEALLDIRSYVAISSRGMEGIHVFEMCCNALKEINK